MIFKQVRHDAIQCNLVDVVGTPQKRIVADYPIVLYNEEMDENGWQFIQLLIKAIKLQLNSLAYVCVCKEKRVFLPNSKRKMTSQSEATPDCECQVSSKNGTRERGDPKKK